MEKYNFLRSVQHLGHVAESESIARIKMNPINTIKNKIENGKN